MVASCTSTEASCANGMIAEASDVSPRMTSFRPARSRGGGSIVVPSINATDFDCVSCARMDRRARGLVIPGGSSEFGIASSCSKYS